MVLERETLSRASRDDQDVFVSHLIRPIVAFRQDEAVGLTIHSLRAKGSGSEEDLLSFQGGKDARKSEDFELDDDVFLEEVGGWVGGWVYMLL